MPWELLDGPHDVSTTGGTAVGHGWRIRRGDEPPRRVTVFISDVVMANNDPALLPEPVMQARISDGESAVATVLHWDDPPSEIHVTTDGLHYGQRG